MSRLAEQLSGSERTELEQEIGAGTQLAIYSKNTLGAGFQNLIAGRVAAALRGFDTRVERVVVRFEDLNGPKGGTDTSCRIQAVLSGKPVLVVEGRASGEAHAFRLALPRLAAAVTRQRGRDRSKPRDTLRIVSSDALL